MMFRFFAAAALALAAVAGSPAHAQSQEPFFPSKPGTVLKYEDRDASGKLVSSSRDSVASFSGNFSKGRAEVISTQTVQDSGQSLTAKEQMIFDGGEVIVDVAAMMQETIKETVRMSVAASGASEEDLKELDEVFADMEVKGESRGVPANLSVGMQLPDYSVSFKVMFVNTKINCKDRKVTGQEKITTPAGTFDCYVIEETVNVKSMFMNEKSTVKTWYARGIGAVRQETWNKKKLESVSELVGLS